MMRFGDDAYRTNLCYAILAGVDVSRPVPVTAVAEGRRIAASISMAAEAHPTLGEALRNGAGYSWHV